MFKTIQIISTVVFAVFCVLAAASVYNLGLGWYTVPLVTLVFAGLMWEVWIQPARDEAMYQKMIAGLDDWDYKPKKVGNITTAQETIGVLQARVDYVTDAYAALKAEQEEKDV